MIFTCSAEELRYEEDRHGYVAGRVRLCVGSFGEGNSQASADVQKKSDKRILYVSSFIGGMNLAAGNIPGWLICTAIGVTPRLVHWYQNKKSGIKNP